MTSQLAQSKSNSCKKFNKVNIKHLIGFRSNCRKERIFEKFVFDLKEKMDLNFLNTCLSVGGVIS